MKTGPIIAIVLVALLLTIAVVVYTMSSSTEDIYGDISGGTILAGSGDYDDDLVGGDAAPGTVSSGGASQTFTVEITSSGFSPDRLEINQGDTVTWINKKSGSSWPASDNHPTHNIYSGFDAKRPLSNGETYSFTFDKVGTWGYHDHLDASTDGTIVVN